MEGLLTSGPRLTGADPGAAVLPEAHPKVIIAGKNQIAPVRGDPKAWFPVRAS